MELDRQCTRLLHDEHMAATALLERLASLFRSNAPGQPPDTSDGMIGMLLADVISGLGSEIPGHFRLEEESLFPLLVDAGEATIVELLNQEHEVIEPLMGRIAVLAREVRAQEFTAESWSEFFRLGGELVERLLIHIEKEEVGLLPLLEDVLDADADADVAGDYVMNQR
jgi:hemerythrin-like domain-containing protein